MLLFSASLLLAAANIFTQAAPTINEIDARNLDAKSQIDFLDSQGLLNLKAYRLLNGGLLSKCNTLTASVRQEWRSMQPNMRKQFTDAVTCLHGKPSKMAQPYPGVKSRYDDYVALHIEQDRTSHFTATFLSWHRYVVWSFEQDLKNMCGYTGSMPYWDWGLDYGHPEKSSMFNGDAYSMGSNGAYVPRSEPIVFKVPLNASILATLGTGVTNLTIPGGTGTGGGCLTKGPFSKLQAHMGPNLVDAYGPAVGLPPLNNPFVYNPRCIKRDINPWVSSKFMGFSNILNVLTNYNTIENFQAKMQADSRYEFTRDDFGLHAGGHLSVGGDPFADQPSTPGDPLWFLHHAQIDRLWYIWQNQDPKNRLKAIAGTGTILNIPPSPPVKLTDIVDIAYVGGAGPKQVQELLSSLDGPFCYRYE